MGLGDSRTAGTARRAGGPVDLSIRASRPTGAGGGGNPGGRETGVRIKWYCEHEKI